MTSTGAPPARSSARATAVRLTLLYALGAALWILGSDWLLERIAGDAAAAAQLGLVKGWLFVVVTALLLYRVLRRQAGGAGAEPSEALSPLPRWPMLAATVAVVLATAGALHYHYWQQWRHEAARIEAVANLQVGQIDRWLGDRMAAANFIAVDPTLAELSLRWRDARDTRAAAQIMKRLAEFAQANDYDDFALLDAGGDLLVGAAEAAAAQFHFSCAQQNILTRFNYYWNLNGSCIPRCLLVHHHSICTRRNWCTGHDADSLPRLHFVL